MRCRLVVQAGCQDKDGTFLDRSATHAEPVSGSRSA
jgi:hypothetical protein